MKNLVFTTALLFIAMCSAISQKYFTRSGEIVFVSDAPMEKIDAKNSKASSVIDMADGQIQWGVLVRAFQFEKALMQEHFNENYMESSKFPKALFKGSIKDHTDVDFTTDGTYEAEVMGVITIRGKEKEVSTHATFDVSSDGIMATSTLELELEDFDIAIPNVVKDNLAKSVELTMKATYQPLPTKK